mmetsp:Transcript_56326/g.83734  ORF Transcript_56326/g.83734 Transcript_56326/m.83734 type:complete len:109 (-) Transcript_56326:106-432(-)
MEVMELLNMTHGVLLKGYHGSSMSSSSSSSDLLALGLAAVASCMNRGIAEIMYQDAVSYRKDVAMTAMAMNSPSATKTKRKKKETSLDRVSFFFFVVKKKMTCVYFHV